MQRVALLVGGCLALIIIVIFVGMVHRKMSHEMPFKVTGFATLEPPAPAPPLAVKEAFESPKAGSTFFEPPPSQPPAKSFMDPIQL